MPLDLERYAELSARIAEGDRGTAEVLEAAGLSEQEWLDTACHWGEALADDVRQNQGQATLIHRFSDAFARAQDRIKSAPEWRRDQWDALQNALAEADEQREVLAAHGLSMADYFRLLRRFVAPQPG
jgi:hypothetical protein